MQRLVWSLVFLGTAAFGGETAVLSNGMRIHVDRHEEAGAAVRLIQGQGVTEIPRSAVAAFEPDDPVPAPTQAAAQPAPVDTPAPPQAANPADARTMVKDAATRAGLPPAFVESVAKTESGLNSSAISPKGAVGVMQLMPATAKALGADPQDPEQNIDAGARLLRDLLLKYNGDVVKALAAYNAGESAVDHYQGVPPYPETQHYVNTVVQDYLKSSGASNNGGSPSNSGASKSGKDGPTQGAGQ